MSAVAVLLFCYTAPAQAEKSFNGIWEGKLQVGIELRIVFNINKTNGGWISTADSPDQGAYGLKTDTTVIRNDSIYILMSALHASLNGRLLNDTSLQTVFTQGTQSFDLVLKKVDKPSTRNRPQTPRPPFSYLSEEVFYFNRDKSIQYGATITIPKGKGPFPAAILVSGSGAQDRDANIFNHPLFAILADHLTNKGFIILRVDDRGVGKTTGSFAGSTTLDFANDVQAGIEYLHSRIEVDKQKLGIIGHSEGGMIAPIVATERNDINFLVLLAAPGIEIVDLMAAQSEAIARSGGVSEAALKEIPSLFRSIVNLIRQSKDSISAINASNAFLEDWAAKHDPAILSELNLATVAQRKEYSQVMTEQIRSPWYGYFINFKPGPYLQQLKTKTLALNGDKDIQVISGPNLEGIKASLQKSSSKTFDVIEVPGLNHLFQQCKKCTVNEYGELEESFSPIALDIISNWMEKNIK